MIPELAEIPLSGGALQHHLCGTWPAAVIPELVKVFTSVHSAHVKEVVTSSEEGGSFA